MWSKETAVFLCAPQHAQDQPNIPAPELPSGTHLDIGDGFGRIPAGPYYAIFHALWYHTKLPQTSQMKLGTRHSNSEFTVPIPMRTDSTCSCS